MHLPHLPMSDMSSRHPGLTSAIAENYFEAASICLNRHHTSPTQVVVQNNDQSTLALLAWGTIDDRTRHAWANESDATRDGAYACALAATELLFDMVAIRRAETLTGADYYIGRRDQSLDDLEDHVRLEVSGIDSGNEADIARRVKIKLAQAAKGKSNLPAMACVIGFRVGKIVLKLLEVL